MVIQLVRDKGFLALELFVTNKAEMVAFLTVDLAHVPLQDPPPPAYPALVGREIAVRAVLSSN